MSDEDAIHQVLRFVYEDDENDQDSEFFCRKEFGYEYNAYRNLVERMVEEDLVRASSNTDSFLFIRPKGVKIVKSGGYLKYFKEQEEEKEFLKEKQEYELKLNKYLYHAGWLPHGMALVALIFSLIALFQE